MGMVDRARTNRRSLDQVLLGIVLVRKQLLSPSKQQAQRLDNRAWEHAGANSWCGVLESESASHLYFLYGLEEVDSSNPSRSTKFLKRLRIRADKMIQCRAANSMMAMV